MKYKTIYADPPWEFRDKLDDSRKKPYKTMSIDELSKLPISSLADSGSHLYLWVPNSHLEEGLWLMKAWGYKYYTNIVWVKLTSNNKLWFGMGRNFRNSTELLLFGVRGNLRTLTRNTRNVVFAKRPALHSAKPVDFYWVIEWNSPAPRLELFARAKREGWDVWGNEVESTIQM
jgi:N6-adenosine-specific RNA methylase IME4